MDSIYGYLLIQSYTEETIQSVLQNFLEKIFEHKEEFFTIEIKPFVPEKIIEKFQNEATIKAFNFISEINLSDKLRDGELFEEYKSSFGIKIEITPQDKTLKPDDSIAKKIINTLKQINFGERNLDKFKKKMQIENKQNDMTTTATYDIEKEVKNIKPTIYLINEGIKNNENTGLPDFKQIKNFCNDLLKEVKKEFLTRKGNEIKN